MAAPPILGALILVAIGGVIGSLWRSRTDLRRGGRRADAVVLGRNGGMRRQTAVAR